MKSLSVIILNLIKDCLEYFEKYQLCLNYEIIIVDNMPLEIFKQPDKFDAHYKRTKNSNVRDKANLSSSVYSSY